MLTDIGCIESEHYFSLISWEFPSLPLFDPNGIFLADILKKGK